MLTYEQARRAVIDQVHMRKGPRATAVLSVWSALGYVLAEEVRTDRDYPPFDRSIRDGYAVRAADVTAEAALPCHTEIKAGDAGNQPLAPGTCAQIMTGAALPPGADAVVMVEHTQRNSAGDKSGAVVRFDRPAKPGQHIIPQGLEARAGQTVLTPGTRLGYAELALAAQVGRTQLICAVKPRVAILSTGDEIVGIDEAPGPSQIRNSNSVSLSAQVKLAGGDPVLLGNAPDRAEDLRSKIERGVLEDLLILSGGVSMGKYDLVESVLKEMRAHIYFDAVAIRPGKPAVFGYSGGAFVFGLPGNPVSTMVTFELFVVPAIDLVSGAEHRPFPLFEARLGKPLREKPGLTHFIPARVEWCDALPEVVTLSWQGSGDIVALARANCFLVVPPDRENVDKGERVLVLMRKDVI
jgi:molybdopterin molybdotransferase